jgi:DNA repair exonuclease SbcCD ATPase subunit
MSSISEITRQVQEAGLYDKQQCPHCGLPFGKRQNDIDCYQCGSSYSDTLKPNWARSMTCLELENQRLREQLNVMDEEALLSSDVFETDRSIKRHLAQQIEKLKRELNAANSIIRQQQLLDEENLGLRQRIKRLEAAGDAMAEYLASGVDVDNWTAAKEAKS